VAWARVQSKNNSATAQTTLTITFTGTPVTGNKIAVFVTCVNGTTVSTVKDGNLVSLTQGAVAVNASNVASYVYFYDVPATPSTVFTITASGSSNLAGDALEVSGLLAGNTTACLDGACGLANGTTSPAAPVYSSTIASEFLFTYFGDWGNGSTCTVPAGLTLDANSINTSTNANACVGYGNTSGGSDPTSWAFTAAPSQWAAFTGAFKLADAARPLPQPIPWHVLRVWIEAIINRAPSAAAPQAATGAADTTQHTETDTDTTKKAAGTATATGRATTAATGIKGVANTGQAGQHTETGATKAAQASTGAAAATQRDTTATTTVKKATGTSTAAGRTATASTGLKGAASPAAAAQRDTTASATLKKAANAAQAAQRDTTADATSKQAANTARADQRNTGQATTFTPPSGAVTAQGRTATSSTGKRGAASQALASTRPATGTTCKRATTGTAHAATRPATTSSVVRRAQAPAHATQHVITRSAGAAVAAFTPAYVSVDATTSSGGLDSAATGTTTDAGTSGTNLDTQAYSGAMDAATVPSGMVDA
jgi:hypothetical protein